MDKGTVSILNLYRFSRLLSGYPESPNSPPKRLLAHLLYLNDPSSWSVLLRVYCATDMHILGLWGTEVGLKVVGMMLGYAG